VVLMAKAGLMTMLSACVLLCAGVPESVAFTVKLEVLAAVGVPLIAPPVLKFKPAGRVPLATVQVTVPVPPELFSVAL
jgi:hypothetical protein